jgi:transcriptional regulator with XRE-family HTH domain
MARGPFSPAALALMGAGITLRQIAAPLGTTEPTVSRWLRGQYRPPAELFAVVAALGGRDLADRVRELIPADVRGAA